jgi:hypothetical protein
MYTLSVGAIFKNEGHALKEWIEHYLHHGVDHIYLINDKSTDNSVQVITPYVSRGLVTLFHADHPYYLGRQRNLYNEYILPKVHAKETKWLLMCDLDEFVWSPSSLNLKDQLETMGDFWQIQMEHTVFGSNGHDANPSNIVASYTRRSAESPTKKPGLFKYFVNSHNATFSSLNIHFADGKPHQPTYKFMFLYDPYFVLNHYCCQSKEFWRQVKCTRGDADNYRVRTMADFDEYDLNDVLDLRLLEQNRSIRLIGE